MVTQSTKRLCWSLFAGLIFFVALPGAVSADSFAGSMDAGKTVMVFTGTWSGSDAGTTEMKVFTKRAASYSLAELAGTWYLNSLASGIGAPWWERGTLIVGSNGSYTMTAVDNFGEPDSGSGTFSLATGGAFTISASTTGKFWMDADKTFVAGSSTWPDNTTELPILTKRAASYSTADLTGTWFDHTLASGPGAPQWERGTYTFTTNGELTYTKVKSNGHSGSGTRTMTITTDGLMTIPGNTEPLQCSMDAGKTVIACTNTWLTGGSDNGTTSISIGLKKAASYSSADLVGTWDSNSIASGPGAPFWERTTITISADGSFTGTAAYNDNPTVNEDISGTIAISSDGLITPLTPGQYLLSATATGSGGGTVSYGSGDIFYVYPASAYGAAAVTAGTPVTLTATADADSTASWSGGCGSTGGSPAAATCAIATMNAAKSVAALFARKPVRIVESATYFTAIQAAYDAAADSQTVQMQAATFNENLLLDNPNAVRLVGGYNTDYSSNPGWTVITGTVTLSGGTVTVENLSI